MLSPNQAILLRAIISAPEPISAEKLMKLRKSDGAEFGESAARNACKRMEDSQLVVSTGAGRARKFAATRDGVDSLVEASGAAPTEEDDDAGGPAATNGHSPDSGPKKQPRPYTVLEEVSLADVYAQMIERFEEDHGDKMPTAEQIQDLMKATTVYDLVMVAEARNTEHARRQVAHEAYEQGEAPVLIAVAGKMWQPTRVHVNARLDVNQEPA